MRQILVLWPEGFEVSSAGLGALMAERGLDISAHRARQVDAAMVQKAELVLGMDASHLREFARIFPFGRGKMHLLGRWGRRSHKSRQGLVNG